MASSLLRSFVFSLIVLCLLPVGLIAQSVTGIKVPKGFEVTKVAGDDLATNVYSMAVSPKGEVLVAGPGYIKVLIDSDADGVFDQTRQFSDGPRSGAMGMCFDGNDLLCCGDGAVLRFVDADGDGVSDGKPVRVFAIKTGGEHDAHSIRKGPDGWWYLLAGNGTTILPEYYASEASPVKKPRAGFLMRISPDWKEKQIYCHGFRNAYDFDFNSLGEVFVYDSDGERDISLPWYRPTRIFRMRPGDDAGFVSRSWKRPSYFYDMPPTVGTLGRGSPTGVVVGQSQQFPASYHDAIFAADWTFGRVMAFRRGADGKYDKGSEFAIADGQFGFAVTDLDFAKDGSLLISVGGRGTEGAIYRVSYVDDHGQSKKVQLTAEQEFVKKSKAGLASVDELIGALESDSQRQSEAAMEMMVLFPGIWDDADSAANLRRDLLGLALHQVASTTGAINSAADLNRSLLYSRLRNASTSSQRFFKTSQAKPYLLSMGNRIDVAAEEFNESEMLSQLQELAVLGEKWKGYSRACQLTLGGCADGSNTPMFIGYTSRFEQAIKELDRAECAKLLTDAMKQTKPSVGLDEIGRLAAMIGFGTEALQAEMAKQLKIKSATAPQDIHWLNCLCRITSKQTQLSAEVEDVVAAALVGLERKLDRDGLDIDRNFYLRLLELAKALFEANRPELALKVASKLTGDASEIFLLEAFPRNSSSGKAAREIVLKKFAELVESQPAQVTPRVLSVLASDPSDLYMPLVRTFSKRRELAGVVVKAVSRKPVEADRELFLTSLSASDLTTVKNAAIGLRRLFDQPRSSELLAAYLASMRLSWDKPSISVRDQLMLLTEKHMGESFETIRYVRKKNSDQSAVMKKLGVWLKENHGAEYENAFANEAQPELLGRLDSIDWAMGDSKRGQALYQKLQCAQCHDGGSRLGPRLEGIAKRFNRTDLFKAIVTPNQQVPQRYRALLIQTTDGKLIRGSMVYESVDGITLQEAGGGTLRINKEDIEDRTLSIKSLMPEGLLNESSDQDLADLFQFLNSK